MPAGCPADAALEEGFSSLFAQIPEIGHEDRLSMMVVEICDAAGR